MEIHEQPTEPWHRRTVKHGLTSTPSISSSAAKVNAPSRKGVSRRALLLGGLAGAGVAAMAGGVALEQWTQHNGWLPGTQVAPDAQIGHLLRRAGFGATPADLTMYSASGFNGAVDRLLNYQNVSDDALEKRLSALQLDFSKVQDMQRWWLLRMAWTQRPLLEKMTLFWHGVLTSSFRKVGGREGYMRMIV